jgi:hypothetical protein
MSEKWSLDLEYKPDFDKAMERVYAWYEGQMIDRAPIQFTTFASFPQVGENQCPTATSMTGSYKTSADAEDLPPEQWKKLWFDAEAMVDAFESAVKQVPCTAETFPIYWPNIGPIVYSAFYNIDVVFEKTTAWAKPMIHDWSDINKLQLDMNNEYFKKIEELTAIALERCKGKYMVGYTDLHPGMDCAAAWRKNESLCMDLYDAPEEVKKLLEVSIRDWHQVYDHFDETLKEHKQLSASWMGIPSFGKMHIPSCDFSAMISPDQFNEFCLPILHQEVKGMTHNIFHLDGPGVARHLDTILEVPQVQAIQWVQGVGPHEAIAEWIPLIKNIQGAGKSVVVTLKKEELADFTEAVKPEGIFLCVYSGQLSEQKEILKQIEKWK